MHLIDTVVDGLPPGSYLGSSLDPVPVSEMSLLHALGPVQTWLGQELEKCGIDAMVYTRYVLSLLLHDSYDYDQQEQDSDIFLGWEKGACKKLGKSKKKCPDLTVEEMKKQAAVQCLRSASDESSGIETLVEELCCRLKDLQSEQGGEKIHKKPENSLPPEVDLAPAAKDQVEMYYEAFPPLSEKPVCLQEIMTVWNKSKMCSYSSSSSSSSSSSNLPVTSTDTFSPKGCVSGSDVSKERTGNKAPAAVHKRATQRRDEKENKFGNGRLRERFPLCRKPARHRPEGKICPRSWSSGTSEEDSNSSGNQDELKTATRFVKVRHKIREMRSKKGRNGQSRQWAKAGEKAEGKIYGSSSSGSGGGGGSAKQLCKRSRRPLKETRRKEAGIYEKNELYFDSRTEREYKEEPLWYTEPIAEYFAPVSRKSKLETTYRHKQDGGELTPHAVEERAESVHCIGNSNLHKAYLAAGTFIDGCFVEMPAVLNEGPGLGRSWVCSPPEDGAGSDGVHLSELTHFYEVDIDQSMLDSGASSKVQGESRILNMIRQKKSRPEGPDFEAGCCIVFGGAELRGGSAIWGADSAGASAEGWLLQDLGRLAHFWECSSSPSSSGDADGESFGGDSPARHSPALGRATLSPHMPAGGREPFSGANEGPGLGSFPVFEVQCSDSLPPFPFGKLSLGDENADPSSNAGLFGKTQSRLLIWTQNSAFDENEHCSNLSTRTCSPWSYSEETRSDNETLNLPCEESPQFNSDEASYVVPRVTPSYVEEDGVGFLQEETCPEETSLLGGIPTLIFSTKSKLESICGIQLEQDGNAHACGDSSPHEDDPGPGVVKDLWATLSNGKAPGMVEVNGLEEELFSVDVNHYCCCLNDAKLEILQDPKKAVQRSEYHLWEGWKDNLEKRGLASNSLSKVDCGDYTTPSQPWNLNQDKESSFILGGVYGELKTVNSDGGWAVVPPPSHPKGSLLQCAASDVVTIAGTDVFMAPGNGFAPGHRQVWRPFVSFEQSEPLKGGDRGLNRGFSFIFHEDLLEACGGFHGEESSLGYSFSSFDLNNPFSQVLHVECTFEPEGIASFTPSFKPKSILCSDSDREAFRPRICAPGRTQYRAIRISPRTHFRPISASELSPCGGSGGESDFDSEKDEGAPLDPPHPEVADDPQADLTPLEEDAEKDGHYYGKLELESGKFLPRLRKCGMEKSAQTSLDAQEESFGTLLVEDESPCSAPGTEDNGAAVEGSSPGGNIVELEEEDEEDKACSCKDNSHGDKHVTSAKLKELPGLNNDLQKISYNQAKQCWWEKALYTPLFPASHPEESALGHLAVERKLDGEFQCSSLHLKTFTVCPNFKRVNGVGEFTDIKEVAHGDKHLLDFNMVSSVHEARCANPRSPEAKPNGFRKKLYSSDSSGSEGMASDGGNGWADPCEELLSRTHL